MTSPNERSDGFAPIESYGVIGDGKSVALIARDGAVDWWAAPAMDSAPVFAALLDPAAGGCFTLEPAIPYTADRRYLPGTNVLETTFTTGAGTVRVTDSMNQGANGPLPWAELARDIQPVSGRVPMRWQVTAGTMFREGRPWVRCRGVPLLHAGNLLIGLLADGAGQPKPGLGAFRGEFTARPGQGALLALVAAENAPVVLPTAADIRRRRDASVAAWETWSAAVPFRGRDRDLVLRSALALKLLTYAPTGAMAAAATSSAVTATTITGTAGSGTPRSSWTPSSSSAWSTRCRARWPGCSPAWPARRR
jgi:GH15 family glucan-1,4-alpha-glucosidase